MNESKWKSYQTYDWANNEKWQMYLTNLYPMPNHKIVEKRRRVWYKKNIEPDFDVEYDPDAP